jgi:hypothetical protein
MSTVDPLDVCYLICLYSTSPLFLIMLFLPFWKGTVRFVQSNALTGCISLVYVIFLGMSFILTTDDKPSDIIPSIFNLISFQKLMQNKYPAISTTIHYLVWDSMMGIWIFLNSKRHQLPHLLTNICLIGVYFAGPLGLLLYLIIRFLLVREWRIFDEFEIQNDTICFLDQQLLENGEINWFSFITIWIGSFEFWKKVFFIKTSEKKDPLHLDQHDQSE